MTDKIRVNLDKKSSFLLGDLEPLLGDKLKEVKFYSLEKTGDTIILRLFDKDEKEITK